MTKKSKCSECKKDVGDRYFYLSIRRRGRDSYGYANWGETLRLRLCCWECLENIIKDPKRIVVEML